MALTSDQLEERIFLVASATTPGGISSGLNWVLMSVQRQESHHGLANEERDHAGDEDQQHDQQEDPLDVPRDRPFENRRDPDDDRADQDEDRGEDDAVDDAEQNADDAHASAFRMSASAAVRRSRWVSPPLMARVTARMSFASAWRLSLWVFQNQPLTVAAAGKRSTFPGSATKSSSIAVAAAW